METTDKGTWSNQETYAVLTKESFDRVRKHMKELSNKCENDRNMYHAIILCDFMHWLWMRDQDFGMAAYATSWISGNALVISPDLKARLKPYWEEWVEENRFEMFPEYCEGCGKKMELMHSEVEGQPDCWVCVECGISRKAIDSPKPQ